MACWEIWKRYILSSGSCFCFVSTRNWSILSYRACCDQQKPTSSISLSKRWQLSLTKIIILWGSPSESPRKRATFTKETNEIVKRPQNQKVANVARLATSITHRSNKRNKATKYNCYTTRLRVNMRKLIILWFRLPLEKLGRWATGSGPTERVST